MNQHPEEISRVLSVLEDFKAININCLHVSDLTSICDYMIILTATSYTHMHALAEKTVESLKRSNGYSPRIEGESDKDWLLIDADSFVMHIMRSEARDYYQLDRHWGFDEEHTKH